jgi:hypothetical protein
MEDVMRLPAVVSGVRPNELITLGCGRCSALAGAVRLG